MSKDSKLPTMSTSSVVIMEAVPLTAKLLGESVPMLPLVKSVIQRAVNTLGNSVSILPVMMTAVPLTAKLLWVPLNLLPLCLLNLINNQVFKLNRVCEVLQFFPRSTVIRVGILVIYA